MNINVILHVLMIDFLAIMSPGPDFFMVLRNTLTDSLKAGVYTVLGIALGSSLVFSLGLFGIGLIVIKSKILFSVIKYGGCAYLSYLAIKSITSKGSVHEPKMSSHQVRRVINKVRFFRVGLICNLTNPKAFLFVVSLSAYVAAEGNPLTDAWFIIIGSAIATLSWFTTVAFIFGNVAVRRVFYSKQRIINILFGVILLSGAAEILFL